MWPGHPLGRGSAVAIGPQTSWDVLVSSLVSSQPTSPVRQLVDCAHGFSLVFLSVLTTLTKFILNSGSALKHRHAPLPSLIQYQPFGFSWSCFSNVSSPRGGFPPAPTACSGPRCDPGVLRDRRGGDPRKRAQTRGTPEPTGRCGPAGGIRQAGKHGSPTGHRAFARP